MTFDEAFKILKKEYGAKISYGSEVPPTKRLPTGSLALDLGLAGGWPLGKITSLNGRFSVGKTAICFHAVAEAQRLYPDKKTIWISLEPFDIGWAEVNGVDVNKLLVIEPKDGEEATDLIADFVGTRELSVAVLDSIGGLSPKQDIEKSADNMQMGTRVKLVKKMLNKVCPALQVEKDGTRNDCAVILINHIYDTMDQYKEYEIAGGNHLKMMASLSITLRQKGGKEGIIRDGKYKGDKYVVDADDKEAPIIGINVGVKTEKDKLRGIVPPFQFSFFNRGGWEGNAEAGSFDDIAAILQYGQLLPNLEEPFIKRSGAWYEVSGKRAQGEAQLKDLIKEDTDLRKTLESEIRLLYNV